MAATDSLVVAGASFGADHTCEYAEQLQAVLVGPNNEEYFLSKMPCLRELPSLSNCCVIRGKRHRAPFLEPSKG